MSKDEIELIVNKALAERVDENELRTICPCGLLNKVEVKWLVRLVLAKHQKKSADEILPSMTFSDSLNLDSLDFFAVLFDLEKLFINYMGSDDRIKHLDKLSTVQDVEVCFYEIANGNREVLKKAPTFKQRRQRKSELRKVGLAS